MLGFIGCAVGLLLASFSLYATGGAKTMLIFAGFMLFTSILGAIITWMYRIETTGVNLDEIGQKANNKTENLTAMATRQDFSG